MIEHDLETRRFTLERDGLVSYVAYSPLDASRVDFESAWVHPAHRGRGIGARLGRAGASLAEARGFKVVPSRWFVAEFIERTPRFGPILDGEGGR